MKLDAFLKDQKLTQHNFIQMMFDETGTKLSQGGLSKYIKGQRIPRRNEMIAIYQITKGSVSPNDFYL
tara:strand:- start:341 stop:544 length:204 start_codon:yes stop_codon:yes gene_type:complete